MEKDDDHSLLGALTSFTDGVGNSAERVTSGVGKTGSFMFASLSDAANKIEASAKGVTSGIQSVGQAGLSGDIIGVGRQLVPSPTRGDSHLSINPRLHSIVCIHTLLSA